MLPPDFIARDDPADHAPHPKFFKAGASHAGAIAVVAGILIVLAAIVGPLLRAMAPHELRPTQSHDEPPGSSGRHGRSGTVE